MQRGNAEGQAFNLYHLKTELAHRDKMTDVFNQMDEEKSGPKRFNLNNFPAPSRPQFHNFLLAIAAPSRSAGVLARLGRSRQVNKSRWTAAPRLFSPRQSH